ncbi:MAG: PEP-CTERM sorting domain-containing protein [Pseudomonadota bacterium]
MNKRILAAAILGMASMASAVAGEILVSDFSGAQVVVNMNAVGAPAGDFTYAGIDFSNTSSGSGSPGWRNLTQYNLGYTDNAGISDITLNLNNVYTKVGLDLYIDASYAVSFFNGNALVGSLIKQVTGSAFAGWEYAGGISRIEIKELSGDNYMVGGFNDVRMEATSTVPEPASLALLGLGLAGFALSRRRKA